jgi:glycosyltransferase involved in cell wall biosynthesis
MELGSPVNLGTIKVCHVASGDRWAGTEGQLATLLKALARKQNLGVSAIFLNEGRLAEEARRCGITVCVVPESEHNFFQILRKATRFLDGKNVQILHSYRYKENLLAALLAHRCGVPFHVCGMRGAPEPFTGWPRYKQGLLQALDRLVARYSTDCVLSVSEELRTQLTRYLPPSKVVTIYSGVDEEKVFSPLSASEAKQRLGIPSECCVIGAACRLDPIKRLDIFLSAAEQIAASRPNVRFVIAGEGREESSLRALAHRLGLEDRVHFLGQRSDIYDVMRAMDIFVLCSDHEGLPNALLESLYLGVPVVVRPEGGVAEVIQDGVNGIWVESSEPAALAAACLELLHDDSRRILLARAGAEVIAKKFTVERSADQLAQLYRSLSDVR